MPFNREIEDFAQAFSSGYSMSKSPQERESEQLTLQRQRFAAERDPIVASQQDELHAIDMQLRNGEISDAEHARKRREITEPLEDKFTSLKLAGAEQEVAAGAHAAERLPVVEKREDLAAQTALEAAQEQLTAYKRANDPAAVKLEQDIQKLKLATAEAENTKAVFEANSDNLEAGLAYKKALAKQADAAAALDAEKARAAKGENDFTDLINKSLDFKDDQSSGTTPSDFGQGQAVPETLPGTGFGRMAPAAPPAIGPTSAVEVEPTVAQRAQEGETISSFNPPGLEGPAEGSTEGLPVEATPYTEAAVPTEGQTLLINGPNPDRLQPPQAPQVPPPAPLAPVTQKTVQKLQSGGKVTKDDIIDSAKEAGIVGLKNSAEMSGITKDNAVDTPETDLNYQSWLSGDNGADSEVAEMALQTVDEATDGKLNRDELFTTTMGLGFLHHMAKGDAAGAQGFATGMVEYGKRLTNQYSAFAQAAAHKGDIPAANMAAMRAYAHVANGQTLEIEDAPGNDKKAPQDKRYVARIMDLKTGKTIHKQIMTPEDIIAQASQMTPDKVVSYYSQAAGIEDKTVGAEAATELSKIYHIPAETIAAMPLAEWEKVQSGLNAKATAAEKGKLSPDELRQAREDVSTSLDTFITSNPTLDTFFNDEEKGRKDDLKTAAEQLYQNNVEIGPDAAVAATMNVLTGGLSEPPVMSDDDPMVTISVEGLGPLKLPKEVYKTLVTLRKMGEFREPMGPAAPGKGISDYMPDAVPSEAVPTEPGAPAYSPRFNVQPQLPAGPGPAPLENIYKWITQPAPEKSRMPSRAVGSQKRAPEIKYRRGTQPPRR